MDVFGSRPRYLSAFFDFIKNKIKGYYALFGAEFVAPKHTSQEKFVWRSEIILASREL